MGQAKRRGSYSERVSQAVARRVASAGTPDNGSGRPVHGRQMLSVMAMASAMFQSHGPIPGRASRRDGYFNKWRVVKPKGYAR
jgi:hypothetical protein